MQCKPSREWISSDLHLSDVSKSCEDDELIQSRFRLQAYEESPVSPERNCDDLGDSPKRKKRLHHDVQYITIYHLVKTRLPGVGFQVWKGCLYLADYILGSCLNVLDHVVLELGCGTGLLGLLLAMQKPSKLYLTDIDVDIISLVSKNIIANEHMIKELPKCRVLDWFNRDCNPRQLSVARQGWLKEDIETFQQNTLSIIAADVIYDDELTQALFQKAADILKGGEYMLVSLEKRMNFELGTMQVEAHGYRTFIKYINGSFSATEAIKTSAHRNSSEAKHSADPAYLSDTTMTPERFYVRPGYYFKGEKVTDNFPQRLEYDRGDDLEIWRIALVRDP